MCMVMRLCVLRTGRMRTVAGETAGGNQASAGPCRQGLGDEEEDSGHGVGSSCQTHREL